MKRYNFDILWNKNKKSIFFSVWNIPRISAAVMTLCWWTINNLWNLLRLLRPDIILQQVQWKHLLNEIALIARFMWPIWGPSGADRTEVGPMLAPWTLLSETAASRSIMPMSAWCHQNPCSWQLQWQIAPVRGMTWNLNATLFFFGTIHFSKWQWTHYMPIDFI